MVKKRLPIKSAAERGKMARRRKMKNKGILSVGLGLTVAGFLCIAAGIFLLAAKREDMSAFPSAQAVLLRKGYHVSMMYLFPYAEVKYTVEGKECVSEYGGSLKGKEVGDEMAVHYDPQNPRRLTPRVQKRYMVLVCLGTVALVIGVCRILMERAVREN